MIVSSSPGPSLRRNLPGEPIHNDPGSTTVFSGISVPAAMIEPGADLRAVQNDRTHADQAAVFDDASVQGDRVAYRDVLADVNAPLLLHAVENAVVLYVRVGADADLVDVAAEDGVHPHRGVLAEDDVADDLGRVVDEAGGRDRRADAFEGSNHASRLAAISSQRRKFNIP